ncbi:hypothetical protein [Streptomyces sp. F-7]|uniref:hypothetical protein n=1 Tax=Streptomyces sp. F-7 TaxID=573566 RepID=UPI000B0A43A4|nr:hypothetical protein [Streptomyces sp. F-7]
MDLGGATTVVKTVTGRATIRDALAWLYEDRKLSSSLNVVELLEALVIIAEEDPDGETANRADRALKSVCRRKVSSAFDPGFEVLALETVTRPATYREALDEIVARSASHSLANITVAAVAAAQQHNQQVMATLCALAGLSYSDLRARVVGLGLPTHATGPWKHEQLVAAFDIIDDIITGTVAASSEAAHPMRPVEHLLPLPFTEPAPKGWELVERMRTDGVPLEVLLTQRAVGSSWGAHRNSTNNLVPAAITTTLCRLLRDRKVPHTELRRDSASRNLLARVGAATDAAEASDDKAAAGQVTVLVHTPAGFAHAVAVSVARDGGTASKSGARLGKLPARFGIPCSVVLVGPGWAKRNETADLARAFEGRIYTEQSLPALADWLRYAATVSATRHTDDATGAHADASPQAKSQENVS